MSEETQYLYQWSLNFFKHRDLIHKRIKEIHEQGDCFIIEYADKKVQVYPLPDISEFNMYDKNGNQKVIITFNTKANLEFLIKNWNNFASVQRMVIHFINPLSLSEKRWHINPHLHNLIADHSNLKNGLKSLYSSVDSIGPRQIKRIIKEKSL